MDQGIATSAWTGFLERENLASETLGGNNLYITEERMNSMFKKCKGNGES